MDNSRKWSGLSDSVLGDSMADLAGSFIAKQSPRRSTSKVSAGSAPQSSLVKAVIVPMGSSPPSWRRIWPAAPAPARERTTAKTVESCMLIGIGIGRL